MTKKKLTNIANKDDKIHKQRSTKIKSYMALRSSRFKVYLLIDIIILEKIFCIMMTVKINYIKDAHNNGKNYFDTDIPKMF